MPLVVTIDVEDWSQSTWDHSLPITEHARRNTEHLLDILAQHRCAVTCFVLGLFAEKFSACVRRMVSEGHEVASHGFSHLEVGAQSPAEYREDVHRAKALLEDLTGVSVKGYRAPDFTLGREAYWALDILAEEGHRYDASIFPTGLYRNGVADWPAQPVRVQLPSGRSIIELPAATAVWRERRWPVAGGGYHRLLPWMAIRWLIQSTLARGETFVSYCHPYEFAPDEFANLTFQIPLRTRMHQGLGRRAFEAKFCRMIDAFGSLRAGDLAANSIWPEHILQPSDCTLRT
jgi:polysaccharide deacetylase family protein (PEP-CTERM system associated)